MKLFDFTADKNKLSSQITESVSVNKEESINESLQALATHVNEGTALCDSPFRHGSKAYIETFQLAKKLREAGSLPELDWESEEMLATDIGEQVTLKGGEKVWLDIPYLIEDEDEAERGMIGEPDDYYDAEERTEAFNDLQDALQGNYMDDYIKDGDCPACGGSGYMDGEETFTNDDGEEEESSECDGFGNYGCDEGEMTYGNGQPSWVEITKHDEGNAQRKKSRDEYPGDEEVIKQVASYMKRMDDPRMAYQQMQADFPHMGRGQRSEILGKASKMAFGEGVMDMDWKSARELDDLPMIKSYNTPEENAVGKILGRALMKKDWSKYSPQELFSELESENPALADDIAKIAKIVYKVQLEEGIKDLVKGLKGPGYYSLDKDNPDHPADISDKLRKKLKQKGVKRGTKPMERPPEPKKGGFNPFKLFNDAISEGEERSIIRDAVVQQLVDTFGESPGLYADNKEDLEAKMYSDLEALHVEDVVDPRMEVGGQPIGDFASGRVLDVVSANEVIEDALQHINLNDMEDFDEGKSPHKKGTKKYKKHMAAMHAGESVPTKQNIKAKK